MPSTLWLLTPSYITSLTVYILPCPYSSLPFLASAPPILDIPPFHAWRSLNWERFLLPIPIQHVGHSALGHTEMQLPLILISVDRVGGWELIFCFCFQAVLVVTMIFFVCLVHLYLDFHSNPPCCITTNAGGPLIGPFLHLPLSRPHINLRTD